MQAFRPSTLLRISKTGTFLWILRNFYEYLFCRTSVNGCLRSKGPEVFCKKVVLKKFTKFTGKHLCQSLFLKKVPDPRPVTLLKKRFWYRCFPVNFLKYLKTPFFIDHLRWLLLLFERFLTWTNNITSYIEKTIWKKLGFSW